MRPEVGGSALYNSAFPPCALLSGRFSRKINIITKSLTNGKDFPENFEETYSMPPPTVMLLLNP